MSQYNVAVIGAGPGGYVTAIRAAQLGFRTVCVDAGVNRVDSVPTLGGTCLNMNCVPSKALSQFSEHSHTTQYESVEHGVTIGDVKLDTIKMIECKDAVMTELTSGMRFLFQKSKIASPLGTASFAGRNGDVYQVEVDNKDEKTVIKAKHVIVATGSAPRPLPQIAIDSVNVLDNEDALNPTEVPAKLSMVGSGVIGLEMGFVWNRVDAEITILEAVPTFLATVDRQIVKETFKYFTEEQGLNIELGVRVGGIKSEGKGIFVAYKTAAGEAKIGVFDKLIVAIGRIPNTKGLNAEAVGLGEDEHGFIRVGGEYRTSLPSVWAIDDVVRSPMLARKANNEGVAVAERIASQKPHIDLSSVSFVIHTNSEAAWADKAEEQFEAEGVEYKKGTLGFGANGRALAIGKVKGTVKVLAGAKTDRISGVHMIGPIVGELVTKGVTTLGFFASSKDIARTIHARPTLSEVVRRAALAVDKRVSHS